MAEEEWFATQSGSEGPCSGVRVCSPSLLSIFKSFYSESDRERFYCFKKFHEQPYERCNTQSVGCRLPIEDSDGRECCCAHGRDGFDRLIDSVIKKMRDVMVAPPLQESVVGEEEMIRQMKNELYIIKLVKDRSAHIANVYGGINKSGISINVSRGENDPFVDGDDILIRTEESANIGVLLKRLIDRQSDEMSGEMNDIVEKKLKAVLIHELRHIWQNVQFKLLPNSEMGQWMRQDDNGAIDIMVEVDAFELQRLFESVNSVFRKGVTEMFLRISQETRTKYVKSDNHTIKEQIRQGKARFLWNEYGYGSHKYKEGIYCGNYIYKNSYGLEHPSSNANTTQTESER